MKSRNFTIQLSAPTIPGVGKINPGSTRTSRLPEQSSTLDEPRKYGHAHTPYRYADAEVVEETKRLMAQLPKQQDEVARFDATIARNVKEIEYG
ncbi:MAG: hypothetical protein ACP5MI_08900 [Candidatus Kryptoniota bacterium]